MICVIGMLIVAVIAYRVGRDDERMSQIERETKERARKLSAYLYPHRYCNVSRERERAERGGV